MITIFGVQKAFTNNAVKIGNISCVLESSEKFVESVKFLNV